MASKLIKNFPLDYMSPLEQEEYLKLDNPEPTTAAKRQDEKNRAEAQDRLHEVLKGMTLSQTLDAVRAHIEARPDLESNGDCLMEFSNHIGRIAWRHI